MNQVSGICRCGFCAMALMASVSAAFAADYTITYGGGTTTVEVVEGKVVDIADAQDGDSVALVTALGGAHKTDVLLKTGLGRLEMTQDLSAFLGPITVKEGRMRVTHKFGLGPNAASAAANERPVAVLPGATLIANDTASDPYKYKWVSQMTFKNCPFLTGGFGADGSEGAYYGEAGQMSYGIFDGGMKTLLADTRWNGVRRVDVRSGTFDMNQHTLYVTNSIGVTGATIINPGHIVVEPKSSLGLENTPVFGGGETNVVTLSEGSSLTWRGCKKDVLWKLDVIGSARIEEVSSTSSGTNWNCWAGPVEIAEGKTLSSTSTASQSVTLGGKISGAGGIVKTSDGTLNLTSGCNDFTGQLKVDSGTLNVYGLGSVPSWDASRILFTGGTINVYPVDGETGAEEKALDLLRFNATASKAVGFAGDMTLTRTDGYNLSKTAKAGDGTLTLSGESTTGTNELGTIVVYSGSLCLKNAGFVFAGILSGNKVGALWPDVARLVFDEGTVYAATEQPTAESSVNKNQSFVYLGQSPLDRADTRGIVEILDGAVVSNRFSVGYNWRDRSAGALYQRGGRFVTHFTNWGGGVNIGHDKGCGYEEISGGECIIGGNKGQWVTVGNSGPASGVMSLLGGRLQQGNQGLAMCSSGGTGEVHVAGGEMAPSHFTIGGYVWRTTTVGGLAVLNQTGGIITNVATYMGAMSNGTAIASFAGGTISFDSFYGVTNQTRLKSGVNIPYPLENSPNYVNFNGGTVKRMKTASRMFKDGFSRFTAFAGGVTFDSENWDGTGSIFYFDYPLRAPEGKGVQKIKLPAACQVPWNYIGAPFVYIVDPTGQGYGASAHADFDSVNGVITNITVVAPGCNYGTGTYAVLDYMGYTNREVIAAADVTLGESASGGVTKIGASTLKFMCANDYTGWTRVEEGTIDVTVEGSFPAGSSLDLAGGDVKFATGASVTVPNLRGNAGSVNVGVKVTGELIVDCAKMTPGEQFVINGALDLSGATVRVLNAPTGTPSFRLRNFVRATGGITGAYSVTGVPNEWHLTKSADGTKLSFGYARGLMVIVR